MNLVTDFERLDDHENARAQISILEQRQDALENECSRLALEVEKKHNQAQQYLAVIEDKTREIDKLTVALDTAGDEASQERKQQNVLIARLRASVRLNRNLHLPRGSHRLDEFFGHRLLQNRNSNDVPISRSSKWSSDLGSPKVQEYN